MYTKIRKRVAISFFVLVILSTFLIKGLRLNPLTYYDAEELQDGGYIHYMMRESDLIRQERRKRKNEEK